MFEENLFNFNEDSDEKYTKRVEIPQYLPKADPPPIWKLYDTKKYSQLRANISNSSLSNDEKDFLMLAATRHIVFNYAEIADYYAHCSKEMQELMEDSALVIIDFDDAIAKGYVRYSKNVDAILQTTGKDTLKGDI